MKKPMDKPDIVKFFKYVIHECEGCGGKNFSVMNSKEIQAEDQDFMQRFFGKKPKDQKEGMEIEYYCRDCESGYVRFYDWEYLMLCAKSIKS